MQSLFIDDKMDVAEIAKHIDRMKKLKTIKREFSDKIKERKDGRVYVYIKRKQIVARSEEELFEKIYDFLYGKYNTTMEILFPEFLRWKKENTPVKGLTLKIYTQKWNKYFKDRNIVKVPLKDLRPKDFINLFTDWTKRREMTSHDFSNSKSIINGIYDYAINELEIVNINVAKNIGSRRFPFKQVNNDGDVFTLEDREKILSVLENDNSIYSLLIRFAFYVPLRIGELLALKWENIEGNKLRVKEQRVPTSHMNDDLTFSPKKYETVNQTKGYTEKGIRYVLLSKKSLELLEIIRRVNSNKEYIFADSNGRLLNTNRADIILRRICSKNDVKYHSMHKIRFCVAAMYYQKGIPINQIQKFLGHTTLQMTFHYLRDVMMDKHTEDIIAELE